MISAALPLLAATAVSPGAFKTRNVVLVMADGLRWQEIFRGPDPALVAAAKEKPAAPLARTREELAPFLWSVVDRTGRLIGDRARGDDVRVSNPLWFSYPGYSETLVGYVDPWVDSNDPRPNRNVTVYEWLSRQPSWRGGVAAFGAWDVIAAVFNPERAKFPINAGYDPMTRGKITDGVRMLNRIKTEQPRAWGGEPYDAITFGTALEWMKANRPRLTYISLGEPDEWAHAGDYPRYLASIRLFDGYLQELWGWLQSQPQYRGTTTMLVASDHGRGEGANWTSHGSKVADADRVWMAAIGPDTPPRGSRALFPVTNAQVPATIAALLGYDYPKAQPKAAAAMAQTIGR